ncbi:MAG TPA: DRTGG domain-containing protein [Bellilinea sp.]|jgi:predicted transcriptional regulator|nr:DRTGG domain-containing protein [Bellilinea sp.]
MNVSELIALIDGKLLTKTANLNDQILGCGGADLMSDVLTSLQPNAVLLTGLCNPQVVRTAVMADVMAIVLVRGKMPSEDTISLADEERIPLISTPFGMFEVSGRLYKAGVECLEKPFSANGCECE